MESQEKKLRDLIEPVCERLQVRLVDIELRGHRNNKVLSVFADTELGITMQEITDLTREIEDALDMYDPIEGKYRLEISSPGIKRPLKELWQFRKNINRQLQVRYKTEQGKQNTTAILTEADDDKIVLSKNDQKITIPMDSIEKAMVKTNW